MARSFEDAGMAAHDVTIKNTMKAAPIANRRLEMRPEIEMETRLGRARACEGLLTIE